MSEMNKELATKALKRLDEILELKNFSEIRIVIGGGGAMILAHNFLGTSVDIDAVSSRKLEDIKDSVHKVSMELGLSGDWINPHYQYFTNYLPRDYADRLITVFSGEVIKADCLGAEDILVMKLMARREKDTPHINHLLSQNGIDLSIVEKRLEELKDTDHTKNDATLALDIFDDLTGDRD